MLRTSFLTAQEALGPDGCLASHTGSTATHPTICPSWLRAYYACFADAARDPVLVAQHADGTVAGYLALTRRKGGLGGASRDLWSTTNGHSQYTALWSEPGAENEVIASFMAALGERSDWDRLYLQGLPTSWIDKICAQAPRFHPTVVHNFDNRMVAAAPDTIRPEHLPSNKTLRKLRGQMRQLSDQGDLQLIKVTDRAELAATLERYVAAEKSSWKQQHGELLDDDPSVSAFYRDMIAQADGAFCPTIWYYSYEGKLVAGLLLLQNAGEWVMLKVFYDADYARYTLGRNLLFAAVAAAREDPECRKLDTYSHLAKYDSFASHAEPFGDLVLWNLGPRAQALRAANRGLTWLRDKRSTVSPPPA